MDLLFEEERNARIVSDFDRLISIQLQIIADSPTDDELLSNLKKIQNKRNQSHKCFKELLKHVFGMNKSPEFLMKLLNEIIAGKIYLEQERIDLANQLKNLYNDDYEKSYGIIKDIPAETFTSIDEKEKTQFLLEQCRLALLLKSTNEAELILRKIRVSVLSPEEKEFFLLYRTMISVERLEFLEAARHSFELCKISPSKIKATIACYYCVISSSKPEKQNVEAKKLEMMKMFSSYSLLDERMRDVTKMFIGKGIIPADGVEKIKEIILGYEENLNDTFGWISQAITEFNLKIISQSFSRVSLVQISMILKMSVDEVTNFITEFVDLGIIDAKIDQLTSFVTFRHKDTSCDNIGTIFQKFDNISHFIDIVNTNNPK